MSEPRDVLIRHAGRRRVQGGAVSIGRAGRGRTECRHWSEGGRWISEILTRHTLARAGLANRLLDRHEVVTDNGDVDTLGQATP